MARIKKTIAPGYRELIRPTYNALLALGGSGTNSEIYEQVIKSMNLSDEAIDESHLGSSTTTELEYQLAWARTYLKNYGVIENSARSVWTVTSAYTSYVELDPTEVIAKSKNPKRKNYMDGYQCDNPQDESDENDDTEFPEEIKPWREQLADVLMNMDPYGFERLAQRVLRECGFTNVEVTKKSGDGGIDGVGKLKINGIFTFNVAFQCKRYKGLVSAGDIRDFRGSLTTNIEKGIFITTGKFSQKAKEEASNPGKQQIDLIDGDDFINKLAEYEIGLKPVKVYEIDESFFEKI